MTDTLEQLKALAELRAKATRGPWYVTTYSGRPHKQFIGYEDSYSKPTLGAVWSGLSKEIVPDAAFIAAAANIDLPALVAELERLRAENDCLRRSIAQIDEIVFAPNTHWAVRLKKVSDILNDGIEAFNSKPEAV